MMLYRFADAHVTCGFMTSRDDGEAQVGCAKHPDADEDEVKED